MTEALAPITGGVSMYNVADGAQVEEGEIIGYIECMKMMFDICAPVSGTVELIAKLGFVVQEGDVIARIK